MTETELLAHATEFRFPLYPEGHPYRDAPAEAVTVARRGVDRWAVLVRSQAFDAHGLGDHKPIPSERDNEFLTRFRHTRDEAVRIARDIVVPAQRALWDRRLAALAAREGR